jgi:hypothetical protein
MYVAARELAESAYSDRGWMTRDEFQAVASREPELKAVDDFLAQGADLEDLVPIPGAALLDRLDAPDLSEEDTPWGLVASGGEMSKAWWHFWR